MNLQKILHKCLKDNEVVALYDGEVLKIDGTPNLEPKDSDYLWEFINKDKHNFNAYEFLSNNYDFLKFVKREINSLKERIKEEESAGKDAYNFKFDLKQYEKILEELNE